MDDLRTPDTPSQDLPPENPTRCFVQTIKHKPVVKPKPPGLYKATSAIRHEVDTSHSVDDVKTSRYHGNTSRDSREEFLARRQPLTSCQQSITDTRPRRRAEIRRPNTQRHDRGDPGDPAATTETNCPDDTNCRRLMKTSNINRPQTGQQVLSELEQQLQQLLGQGYRDQMEAGSRTGVGECLYDNVISDEDKVRDLHPEDQYLVERDPEHVYENPQEIRPNYIWEEYSLSSSEEEEREEGEEYYEFVWSEEEFSAQEAEDKEIDVSTELFTKRKMVLDEFVSTETKYVNRLLRLFKFSLRVEGANHVKRMLPDDVFNKMFPNVETLYRLHSEHILPGLRHGQRYWGSKPYMCDVMTTYAPFLSVYKMYTSQFSEAHKLISEYRKKSSEFRKLLNNIESADKRYRLTLENLLLDPVLRFSRYKLLLQAYLATLSEREEEKAPLTAIVEQIDKDIKECQAILREKDLYGDIYKVQTRFDETLTILTPNTRLLKEGPATEITSRNYLNKKYRYLFLFSDLLIVCSRKLNGTFSVYLRLDICQIKLRTAEHLVSAGYPTDLTMVIKGQTGVISLLFSDSTKKDEWEEAILKAIEVKLNKHQFTCPDDPEVSNVTFDSAPQWLNDDATSSCMVCDVKFKALVKRRHHCRGCGIIVCSSCSSQQMALPYLDGQVARVCDICFMRGRRSKPELTRRVSSGRNRKRRDDEKMADCKHVITTVLEGETSFKC